MRAALPSTPGRAGIAAICGEVCSSASGSAGRMRTRTSYQPAWPVIGSELLMRGRRRACAPPGSGSSSEIRWFSRKPLRASSAPGASCQAPSALPIAFQVQTVPGSTASL